MSRAERFRRLAEIKDFENGNSNKTDVINKIVGVDSDQNTPPNDNSITEEVSVTVTSPSITKNTDVIINNKTEYNNSNVSLLSNSNSDTEQFDVIQSSKKPVTARIPKPIEEFEKRLKKPTIEQTHTRGTWLVRNDLLKRLEKLAKNQQRGFKTYVVNYALERILDELEGK